MNAWKLQLEIASADNIMTMMQEKQNKKSSLSFVQRPAVDGALGVLEELVIAIFWMRQTYW